MPTPFAPPISLSHKARTELHAVGRASATPPSLGLRARIVVRAADRATPTKLHLGRELGGDHHTVGPWRRRSLALGVAGLQDAIRPGRPRSLASSTRGQGSSGASPLPPAQERTVTRGTRDALGATSLDALHTEPISRARRWRILHDVALKPPPRAPWWHRHDEALEATAHTLGPLDAQALASYAQGRLGLCGDEKPGMHVRERTTPTQPAPPGRRARRAQEDSRPGTRVLSNAVAVATGPLAWSIGPTRPAPACVAPLTRASQPLPRMAPAAWGRDTVPTPWSRDVCRLGAPWCPGPCAPEQRKQGVPRRACLGAPRQRHGWQGTPTPGAWRNPAAFLCRVLPRRFVARGRFLSAKDCARRGERFLQDDDLRHAHP